MDTWGWVVLEDRKDPFHEKAALCYEECTKSSGRVLTSNFVLDETFTILFRRRPFGEAWRYTNALIKSPFIAVELITESRFRKAFDLRKKFSDKPKISFTDVTTMALMSELKVTDILTGDAHFLQVGLGFRTVPE